MRQVSLSYRKQLRLQLKRIKRVKTWQLLVLLLLASICAAIFLRLNNLGMMERRQAVVVADEKGNAVQLSQAIDTLRLYVTQHMNTSLNGGFYLTKSYERAREAAMRAAADVTNPNSVVYNRASVECQSGAEQARYGGYVACVIAKVDAVGGQSDLVSSLKLPSAELYKINFVSPLWSFDVAGFWVIVVALIIGVIIVRVLGGFLLKIILRYRYSRVL